MRREGEGQRGKAGRGKEGLAWVRKKILVTALHGALLCCITTRLVTRDE